MFDANFDDILKGIDSLIEPAQADDHSDGGDTLGSDEQPLPTMPPNVVMRPSVLPSPVGLAPLPQISPRNSLMHPQTKKNRIGRAWNELKKLLTRRFGGDQLPPKHPDGLLSKWDDEIKWYEPLLAKLPKPVKSRKQAYPTVCT